MVKKKAEANSDRRILDRSIERLSCDLTQEEQLDRAQRLAAALRNISAEEGAQESQKKAMKSRLAELEAKRDEIQLVVERKAEIRDIEVEVVADYDKGRACSVRMDTGEIYHERPLTVAERQEKLALVEKADAAPDPAVTT